MHIDDALVRYGNNCKYMPWVDCDKFIVPVRKGENIISLIDKTLMKDKRVAGLAVNWCMFGSSGYLQKSK